MSRAQAIRFEVEEALAHKISSALTPPPRSIRPVARTGIGELDDLLCGGLPVGGVSELSGPECSGRTSVALMLVASLTQAGKVCAWIDVADALDPLSAAAIGVNLERLLWIRCVGSGKGVQRTTTRPASAELFSKGLQASRGADSQAGDRPQGQSVGSMPTRTEASARARKPWMGIEKALRVADLLIQGGGFSALVLDMGGLTAEFVSRVPLATWFRYRAAAERTQSSIVLLTQHPCAKSSAEMLLRFQPGATLRGDSTVFTGLEYRVELVRRRFEPFASNVVPLRKPPQKVPIASWPSRSIWAGVR